MNQKLYYIFLFVLFFGSLPVHAIDRLVTNFGDSGAGTLRLVLQGACEDQGDDVITFAKTYLAEIYINLESPLHIVPDCNGRVTLIGSREVETILDGEAIANGKAILEIARWGNRIQGLTFVGFKTGAGIGIFQSDNIIENNFIGTFRSKNENLANQHGIIVTGDWNTIIGNTIVGNSEDGIIVESDNNLFQKNNIGFKAQDKFCATVQEEEVVESESNTSYIREIIYFDPDDAVGHGSFVLSSIPEGCGNGGSGIHLAEQASRNAIGALDSGEENTIVYNKNNGILIEGSGKQNQISHNVIAHNGGLAIDLGGDGEIVRGEDYGNGPNEGIPGPLYVLHPVKNDPFMDSYEYTLVGQGIAGSTLELYLAPAGGNGTLEFIDDFVIPSSPFAYDLAGFDLYPGQWVTALVCDQEGNCSELSDGLLDRDVDHDGILDSNESGHEGSDTFLKDSDQDGLVDSLEDKNLDGKKDGNETATLLNDSDSDGLTDFVEMGGDDAYDPQNNDTDPLNPDTDSDGMADGLEDNNQNGIIDLGESSPLL